jgi:glycosyltransferase involved in cell wall biosynthesis
LEWEVLVVNNNCSDDTDAVCQGFVHSLPLRVLHQPTPGKVHALNLALSQAQGEYLLLTDDDVKVDARWLTATLEVFENTKADCVFGPINPWWESAPPKWYTPLHDGKFGILNYGPELLHVTNPAQAPFGANYSFRKTVFNTIGPFPTDMGPKGDSSYGGEESDMFRKVLVAGFKAVYTPDAKVNHFIPTDRCVKGFYRRRAWRGSQAYLKILEQEAAAQPTLPRVGGVPRYIFSRNLGYALQYLRNLMTLNFGTAFFYELKLITLAGLVRAMVFRRKEVRV